MHHRGLGCTSTNKTLEIRSLHMLLLVRFCKEKVFSTYSKVAIECGEDALAFSNNELDTKDVLINVCVSLERC